MPDIGTTLREARMRQRIDISDVESATKIRAKYLRALENEEWDLLPGPTFVKSFLRTYADALGLDGKVLTEEYKLHHERLSDVDLQPIALPGSRGARQQQRRSRPAFSRRWIVGALIVGLIVAVYLVGVLGSDDSSDGDGTNRVGTISGSSTTTSTPSTTTGATTNPTPAAPKVARLQIVATGQVYVCLKAGGDRDLIDGKILTDGARQGPYRSARFRLMLGNSDARLIIDGKQRSIPPVTNGIGYEITPTQVRRLPRASWPTCTTA